MPKQTVSVRLPRPVAEQADAHAETHEITRTDTLTLFAEAGLEAADEAPQERAYTGLIRTETVDDVFQNHVHPTSAASEPGELIERQIRFRIVDRDAEDAEYGEEVARSARMPPPVSDGLAARAESQDRPKAVVAAEVIETGMRADPVPSGNRPDYDGRLYTVELDAQDAELFRKYRLSYRMTPDEALTSLVMAKRAGAHRQLYCDW